MQAGNEASRAKGRTTNTGRGSRRERIAATRRKIVRAAISEFAHHGFDKASMHRVSEVAGVANGTVYFHFESKTGLYLAVAQHASEEFHGDVARFAATPEASFIDVVDRELEYLRRNPEIDAILSSLRGTHPRADADEPARMLEAARVVDGRLVDVWRRWIGDRRTDGNASARYGENLPRVIASTVSGLLATRSIDPRLDIRAPLADFGTLVEAALGGSA
ncbi:MAG: TetR/AcrR family transcriptional regulator [Gammaproteobacteria bacterium]|nr:TetR/AcrR family transcriptional regulator [Gammaproteobacteria bacterium]